MALIYLAVVVTVMLSLSSGASVQNLETIESLAASKILKDHTTSSSYSASLPIQVTKSLQSETKQVKTVKSFNGKGDSTEKLLEEAVLSPLHVAQCRATCLQKFASTSKSFKNPAENSAAIDAPLPTGKMNDDDMISVPNLLKIIQRKRRSTGNNKFFSSSDSTACLQDSSECHSCWESCQILEMKTAPAVASNVNFKCFEDNSKRPCMAGCQVACSFYTQLLAKNQDKKNYNPIAAADEAVVATRQESVLKMENGEITWPALSLDNTLPVTPVVYVAIQEYPDRKWRQILQTSELALSIPSQMTTAAMRAKFRSVRVLVVTPQGLHTVYSFPLENAAEAEKSDVSGGVSSSGAIAITTEENDIGFVSESSGAASDGYVLNDDMSLEKSGTEVFPTTTSVAPQPSDINTVTTTDQPFVLRLVSLIHQKSLVIAELRWDGIGDNPSQDYLITWELAGGGLKGHLVTDSTSVTLSLWPDTTYQIQVAQFTQNLDSDGEQPPTDYHSPDVSASSSSLQSLPLVVDTSVASFPLEHPSALLLSGKISHEDNKDELEDEEEEEEYQHDDEYDKVTAEEEEEEETRDEDDKQSDHKFIGKVLCIAVASLVMVLVILSLTAYIYTKLRKLFASLENCEKVDMDEEECGENGASGYFSSCWTAKEIDCELLVSQENSYSEETPSSSPFYSSVPLNSILGQNKKKLSYKCDRPNERSSCSVIPCVPPLAVISSSSILSSSPLPVAGLRINNHHPSAQLSLFDGYHNNTLFNHITSSRNSSGNDLYSHSTRLAPAASSSS